MSYTAPVRPHPALSTTTITVTESDPACIAPRETRHADARVGYSLVKSGPGVAARDIALPDSCAVDVTVLWGADILFAAQVPNGGSFTVGEEATPTTPCDFFMPEQVLGAAQLTLLVVRDSNPIVHVPVGADGFFQMPDQPALTFGALRAGRGLTSSTGTGLELPLPHACRACLRLGQFTFYFACAGAARPATREALPFCDRQALSFFGLSLTSVGAVMMSMAYFVPVQNALGAEGINENQVYAMTQFLTASAERERETLHALEPEPTAVRDIEGGTGTRAQNEEGAMGNPTARAVNRRFAVQGPRDNPEPHIARERLLWEAQHGGMIGLLNSGLAGDVRAPTAPWGHDDALGRDALSAQGAMWGDDLGVAFGANGLGLSGIGEGGGGLGAGIGLGSVGTIGNGMGSGLSQGFGDGGQGLGHGTHKTRVLRMRPGESIVSGRIPPEIIQRIVRQNHGRFRNCYEQGLARNPNLEGRVQVRFVIGRDGAVSNVQNGGSDLPDATVIGCVVSAYYGLSFPEPEGGIVTVVYPIMFQPG